MSENRDPSCPCCKRNVGVERLREGIGGRHFWCWGCNTVFAGTTGEWDAMRGRRKRFLEGFYRWVGWPEREAGDERGVA